MGLVLSSVIPYLTAVTIQSPLQRAPFPQAQIEKEALSLKFIVSIIFAWKKNHSGNRSQAAVGNSRY